MIIILILVFGVTSWFWFKEFSEIKQFSGNLSEVGNNFIVVRGTFVDSNEKSLSKDIVDLKILVDPDAVIKRVAIKIPDTTEMFIIDSLPKEETTADLETMKNDYSNNAVGLFITVKKTFLNKYKAKEIIYRTPVFSQ